MSLLSRLAPGALVGAALLASSFLGSSVSVSVRDRLEGVRDTPVDIIVTSQDPVTVLGGHRYLAPDAWMTQGSVTPDQVRALRDIPGVEVAAPVTVVDLADQDTEQVVSAWVLVCPPWQPCSWARRSWSPPTTRSSWRSPMSSTTSRPGPLCPAPPRPPVRPGNTVPGLMRPVRTRSPGVLAVRYRARWSTGPASPVPLARTEGGGGAQCLSPKAGRARTHRGPARSGASDLRPAACGVGVQVDRVGSRPPSRAAERPGSLTPQQPGRRVLQPGPMERS